MEASIVESFQIQGKSSGILAGKCFFAKDLFDVKGHITGAGNPDWKAAHTIAAGHAWAVEALLNAGANLIGKTLTDELACSLDGINIHYGTPKNPNLPGHIPGGSSSGSASAVAAGLCDFALGTDTAGSVRVPAAYCGILGFRPSHGRVPQDGVLPLGPSFDTVGWFSKEPALLRNAGKVLLAKPPYQESSFKLPGRIIIPEECLAILDSSLKAYFENRARSVVASLADPVIKNLSLNLEAIYHVFSTGRAFEAWRHLGGWLTGNDPLMAPDIKERLLSCSSVSESQYKDAMDQMERFKEKLDFILEESLLCLPTVWAWPPLINAPAAEMAANRSRNVLLTSISSVSGVPQIAIPIKHESGCFFSLSLIAARNKDELLLDCLDSLVF